MMLISALTLCVTTRLKFVTRTNGFQDTRSQIHAHRDVKTDRLINKQTHGVKDIKSERYKEITDTQRETYRQRQRGNVINVLDKVEESLGRVFKTD